MHTSVLVMFLLKSGPQVASRCQACNLLSTSSHFTSPVKIYWDTCDLMRCYMQPEGATNLPYQSKIAAGNSIDQYIIVYVQNIVCHLATFAECKMHKYK